jgi:hypothetical protein
VHGECAIHSRRDIATSERAYQAFVKLEARYLQETGRRAEHISLSGGIDRFSPG